MAAAPKIMPHKGFCFAFVLRTAIIPKITAKAAMIKIAGRTVACVFSVKKSFTHEPSP